MSKSPSPTFELKIHPATYKHMMTYLTVQNPIEGCGVLFGKDGLCVKFLPIPNIHPAPMFNFMMDTGVFLNDITDMVNSGHDLSAFVHSHTGKRTTQPSTNDLASHERMGIKTLEIIVAWPRGDLNRPVAVVWDYPSTAGRLVQAHTGSKLT